MRIRQDKLEGAGLEGINVEDGVLKLLLQPARKQNQRKQEEDV